MRQPIDTAPRDGTNITGILADGRQVRMFWGGGLIDANENECGGWHSVYEGEHPHCWTDGICWDANEDDKPSEPPMHWIE